MRAIAILLVLGRHIEAFPHATFLNLWVKCGWIGVDLFFVISGFLISGLLFNDYLLHDKIHLKNFYARRALKIYPPFYALIAITVIGTWVLAKPPSTPRLLSELVFVQNYFPGLWNHTWSLAVEEHFYIMLPLVLVLSLRWKRGFSVIPVLFAFVAPLILITRFFASTNSYQTYLFPTHLRIDGLLFGVTLSYYYHFRKQTFARIANWKPLPFLSGALILPSLMLNVEDYFMHTAGFTMLYLGFGGVLLFCLRSPDYRRKPSLLASMGTYSYSIYLWHMPMLAWGFLVLGKLSKWIPGLSYVDQHFTSAVYGIGSIILGVVMAKLVEIPVLRCRDRLFPSRSKSALNL